MNLRLGFVAIGDPLDRGTWSATPANLAGAIKSLGVELQPINAQPRKIYRKTLAVGHQLHRIISFAASGGHVATPLFTPMLNEHRSDYAWSSNFRRNASKRVLQVTTAKELDAIIYMTPMALWKGTHSLPQYAYIDSTFSTLLEHSQYPNRFPRGFIRHVLDMENTALSKCSMIFTTSEYVAEDLARRRILPKAQIVVAGVGLGNRRPIALYSQSEKADSLHPRLLFVARNSFIRKGGQLALEAYALVRKQNMDVAFDMVVGDSDLGRIKDAPGVRLYGSSIDQESLSSLFTNATLLLMPALNEPLGLVYLEALAAGTPIVALARNFIPELARSGCAIGVLEESREAIALTVLSLLSDPNHLSTMRAAAKLRFEQAKWETVGKIIVDNILMTKTMSK